MFISGIKTAGIETIDKGEGLFEVSFWNMILSELCT